LILSQPIPTLWTPLPGPQTEAYYCRADELFYGGAAGGGKSDLLLGLALTQHQRAIIFRREYPQLKALIDRSRELVGDYGRFNSTAGTWHIGQRMIELGAVQYEADVRKYQGRPHDLIAFDELPNFVRYQYQFLSGWLRTTVKGQRTRIVGAGNPPTNAEGEWVIQHWGAWLDEQHPDPAANGELRWYAMLDGKEVARENGKPFSWKGETIQPRSRTFIPAGLHDNPYLLSTGYGATLQALPEPLRSQLLRGDFMAGIEDDIWQVIPTAWVKLAQQRGREQPAPSAPLTALGVDVARGGRDKTAIAKRYANWFAPVQRHPGKTTPDGPAVAGLVAPEIEGSAYVNVDVIGVGAAVFDAMRAGATFTVNGINVAERSAATDKSGKLTFVNQRAQLYWQFREALDPATGEDVALPDDPELLADLCAPRWKMTLRGIQVEEKAEIIKRIHRSPDAGEAVILATAQVLPLLLWG
jgi:hypothetical protein